MHVYVKDNDLNRQVAISSFVRLELVGEGTYTCNTYAYIFVAMNLKLPFVSLHHRLAVVKQKTHFTSKRNKKPRALEIVANHV